MAVAVPQRQIDPESSFRAGDMVGGGRFRLERAIGRGGMGVVWQAFDERLKESVALKFISERIRANASALEAMRRETSRSHSLSHQNIVRIHDLHELPNEPAFISMEYVEGKNLHELRPQPHGAFNVEDVWRWTRQLCAALGYAHSRGVIHRDLKPANLMLDRAGELKLADFGLAAAMRDPAEAQDRGVSGTPAYMSPQQLSGAAPAVTDDIYSLGACLFELLTGAKIFEGPDFRRQIAFEPAPLMSTVATKHDLRLEVPEAFEDLVQQCLSKNPAARPQTAEAFLALASEALEERSAGPTEAAKPKRGLVIAALVIAIVAGVIFSAMRAGKLSPPLDLKTAPVRASSFTSPCEPAAVFDGIHRTPMSESNRWASASIAGDADEWLAVDLGSDMLLESVVIDWELAYAKDFTIRTRTSAEGFADDPMVWTEQARVAGMREKVAWIVNKPEHERDVIFDWSRGKAILAEWLEAEAATAKGSPVIARHVMINPTARGANNNGVYSIYEIEIRGKPAP